MELVRWAEQPLGMRVLRVWLGITFLYAGIQKLSDPGFLRSGSTTYIGTQLTAFAHGSPIAPLLDLAGHVPVLAGAGVALTEILIGVATLAGVAPVVAAGLGVALSLTLWLSATWHVHPYFLGSDSVYAVAWLTYLLMLPSIASRFGPARPESRSGRSGNPANRGPKGSSGQPDDERRRILQGGAVVVGSLVVGGVAAAVGASGTSKKVRRTTAAKAPTGAASSAKPTASGPAIASLAEVRRQGAVAFDDSSGNPAVVVSLGGGKVAAFSRVCTHAGCSVDFDPSAKLLVCPCHGATYDPAQGASVVGGPAPAPLPAVPVVVDTSTGQVRQA